LAKCSVWEVGEDFSTSFASPASLFKGGGFKMLYEDLKKIDFIEGAERILGRCKLTKDDKLRISPLFEPDTSWVNVRVTSDRLCARWHGVYFKGWGLVPAQCRGCFKVVCHPASLKGLLAIHQLQKNMDLVSKCGMDTRDYVPHLYSAFWYGDLDKGLDGGRELYRKVKPKILETIGAQTNVILKRGCTEFELRLGPSDTWKWTEKDEIMQSILDSVIEMDDEDSLYMPKFLDFHVMRKWIEWAWSHGDQSAREFLDGPLVNPTITYHDSKHEGKDFLIPILKPEINDASNEEASRPES